MVDHQASVGSLAPAIEQFLKVTVSFAPGLFHCYDVPDLPRTNNALEQCFGSVRHHERRATGRCGAVPGLVVRGSVRVVAALAARFYCFTAEELRLRDDRMWRQVRERLAYREEARRRQFRFRNEFSQHLQGQRERNSRRLNVMRRRERTNFIGRTHRYFHKEKRHRWKTL